jgi:hypothetical protein
MEKRSRSRALAIIAGLALGGTVTAGVAGPSLATGDEPDDAGNGGNQRYNDRSIKGTWGFSGSFGVFIPPGTDQQLPMVGMGRAVFDGHGGCQVTSIVNLNGQTVTSQSSSCKYRVGPDGIGTSEAVFPNAPVTDPFPISFVIVDGGRELRAINTRFIVSGLVFKRQ